jgi:hypothetical protein
LRAVSKWQSLRKVIRNLTENIDEIEEKVSPDITASRFEAVSSFLDDLIANNS